MSGHPACLVRFSSRFFACREVSLTFLAFIPVVHANVDCLPVGTGLDSQKNAVDSRRTRRFPRAFNQFGIGAWYLRVLLARAKTRAD
jgi:hypothetical protein